MIPLRIRQELGLQLLIFYLLFVGTVLATVLIFNESASARLERDTKAADLALGQSIALETDAVLRNALSTVTNLSLRPEVQTADISRMALLFQNISDARSEVDLVYQLDQHGIMLYHYPEGPGSTVGQDFSFRSYFKNALTAHESHISEGRISPTTGQPVVTAYMPIRNDKDEFLGVVATNLNLHRLSITLAHITTDAGNNLRLSILDDAGHIVADSSSGDLLADARSQFPTETEAVLQGQQGSQLQKDPSGREWLRTYVPLTSSNWGVVVARPADQAFETPHAFEKGIFLASGVFLLGGLLFWLLLSNRVITPLEQLAKHSASIGEPKSGSVNRFHIPSLRNRSDQIGRLVESLERAEQNIQRRFTELTTLLDTSTAVVSTLDSQQVLETILDQVRVLLSVTMCAIVVLDERTGEMHLRAAQGLSEEYLRTIRNRTMPLESNVPSLRAISSGRVVHVADTETDLELPVSFRERARLEGYRALMAVPLVAPHSLPAALLVYWREPHLCSVEEMGLIVNFANHAAMAIENAALFALTDEKLREQTRTLEALVQSLDDGLILESSDGLLLTYNRRICELAGITFNEFEQHSAASLRSRLVEQADGQDRSDPREISIIRNGQTIDLRLHRFDVRDDQGQMIGRGEIWSDVTGDKQVDRMKSSLIAIASHELRSPLAIIKGNITSLLAQDVEWNPADQREFLEAALLETDRMSALVTDLLDLSRIQGGTFVVNREACILEVLVEHSLAHIRPSPTSRLRLDVPPDLPLCDVDPRRIEAVLHNLVENALKYGLPDAPIQISATPDGGYLVVKVSNEGPEIPEIHRERIFDRFYRIDNTLSRVRKGAGLGLAICKGFVEAHGGSIWVESSEMATTFSFTLPVMQSAVEVQ